MITGLFAAIYKMMPRAKIAWHDVWIGAAVTALLFRAGKFLIGLYLGKSGVTSAFGAAGSMVVLLIWVYYSAQIFLLGAEFTWVYAHKRGSRGRITEVPVSELVTERTADPTATPVESRPVSAFNAANVQWVDREIDGPHRLIEPPGRAAYIAGHSVRNLGIVVLCGLVTGAVLRRLVPPAQLVDRPTRPSAAAQALLAQD